MDKYLEKLSDYIIKTNYEDLPKKVIHQVKRLTIDSFGCAIGGYDEEPPRYARAHAATTKATPGATIIGTKQRTSAELAAFANGVMIRYLDFNDSFGGNGHPSTQIAAVAAAAEAAGADIKSYMIGLVLSYEIQNRIGDARIRDGVRRPFDHSVVANFGAVAAAAKVIGCNKEQTANALALAAVNCAALGETRRGQLSMWKGCAEGYADRNGVFFAQIAKQGITGPGEAFEGVAGVLKSVTGNLEFAPFGSKRNPYEIELARFKYFPTDYEVQCAVHPVLELRQLLGGDIKKIEKVLVEAYGGAVFMAADTREKWNPKTRETADHSMPYILATAFVDGTIWSNSFDDKHLHDKKIYYLMQKIEVKENPEFTKMFPEANPFKIEVTTKSGEKLVKEIKYAKGHFKNPMSDEEIETKFRKLTEPVFGSKKVTSILAKMWKMDEMKSISEVMNLFVK